MEWLSKYLVAVVAAWLVANLAKMLVDAVRNKKINRRSVLSTGGMPSTHTAPVVALTTVVGLVDGVGSVAFAIVLVLAIITMTDAVKVRRAVGEQGKALEKLLPKNKPKPYRAAGHKLTEVIVGALIGVIVGAAVCCVM
jgi:acid phosphatase family membrane protein YuiD